MSRNRIAAGVATVALGLVLTAGVAQADDCYVGCTPPNTPPSGVLPNNEVAPVNSSTPTNTNNEVLPLTDEAPAAATATPAASPATSGGAQLPFTGADVAELSVVGLAAVGAGVLTVRRSRRRTAS